MRLVSLYMLLLTVSFSPALSQVDPVKEQGTRPYGSYDATDIDSVNLQNGGLSVKIPIFSYAQRGKFGATVELLASGKQWNVIRTCNTYQGYCTGKWGIMAPIYSNALRRYPNVAGVGLAVDDGAMDLMNEPVLKQQANGHFVQSPVYSAVDIEGGSHPFYGNTSYGDFTVDGSGIVRPIGYGSVIGRDGTKKTSSPAPLVEDVNGNIEQSTSGPSVGQDSLGRGGIYNALSNAQTLSDTSGCQGSQPIVEVKLVSLPGPNGGTRQIKLCSITSVGTTNFDALYYEQGSPNDQSSVTEGSFTTNLLQSVAVYDGASWTTSPTWIFEYNNNTHTSGSENYFDLTKITLPTGGTISYTWVTHSMNPGSSCGLTDKSRYVAKRAVDAKDGSPAQISVFTYNPGRVTDAQGNYVVHQFGGQGCNTYETQTEWHELSSDQQQDVIVKKVTTDYDRARPNTFFPEHPSNSSIDVLPTRITTTLANNQVSKIEKDYDSSLNVTYYDPDYEMQGPSGPLYGSNLSVLGLSRGLVTELREYSLGTAAPGPLVRCTRYSYKALENSAYMTANILDLPTKVSVYGGACGTSTLLAQTTYGYDESSLQPSGVTTQRDATVTSQTERDPVQGFTQAGAVACIPAHRARQRFGKDPSGAGQLPAEEPPGLEHDPHRQALSGQIAKDANVAAMNSVRTSVAGWTDCSTSAGAQVHLDGPGLGSQTDKLHFGRVR